MNGGKRRIGDLIYFFTSPFIFQVHVARAGILSIAYLASTNTTFSSAGGNCRVTGPGGIVVNSGSFICEGNLTIGSGTATLLFLLIYLLITQLYSKCAWTEHRSSCIVDTFVSWIWQPLRRC